MLPEASTFPCTANAAGRSVERRFADFHPSVWGDYFLRYSLETYSKNMVDSAEETIQRLVEEVKAMMLTRKLDDPLEKLELIDHVQHLGIDRHFEKEIDEQLAELRDVYPEFANGQNDGNEQLHSAALVFRLLRRQGYNISSEVFNKFKRADGKFRETLTRDKLHQKEVCEILKWWNDWDFPRKTSFARDRIVECYFWSLGVYFEPEFTDARKFLTKGLLALYHEAETELASQGRLYRLPYVVQSMKDLSMGYLAEAKWFFQKYTPTLDEYVVLAFVTTGYALLVTNSFIGMGDGVTEDAFQWVSGNPQMLKAATMVCRFMDDVAGHKFEQKRGHVASAVECYIRQYGGTEQEAEAALNKRVFDAWKDINEALLRPLAIPAPVLTRLLNFTRVMDVLYKDGDSYTHSGTLMKRLIGYLLVDDSFADAMD
ncbi:hypothetical protein MLD38_002263 [Melastoma candidum]|uniref:Uncharacterized protein n=1 Tax=Melastoma candidum TaxID=119954 RepID=A0ACB9SFS1_9MYRT|nr:hypothetical protein MLD38_002263 [Melastoma candidum]